MPGVRFPVTEFIFFFLPPGRAQEASGTRARQRRGIGAIGSVRPSQGRGTGIETLILQIFLVRSFCPPEAQEPGPRAEQRRGIGAIGSVRP